MPDIQTTAEGEELAAMIDEWIDESDVVVSDNWSSRKLAEYLVYWGYERKQP